MGRECREVEVDVPAVDRRAELGGQQDRDESHIVGGEETGGTVDGIAPDIRRRVSAEGGLEPRPGEEVAAEHEEDGHSEVAPRRQATQEPRADVAGPVGHVGHDHQQGSDCSQTLDGPPPRPGTLDRHPRIRLL